jgi:hypothetical protein
LSRLTAVRYAALAALLATSCASAAIIPLSQFRTVSAAGSVQSPEGAGAYDGDSASAPDFSLFDDAAGFAVSYADPVYYLGGNANGIAKQRSSISPSGISAYMMADASAGAYDYEFYQTSASGTSTSIFQVTFRVTETRTFRFAASGFVFDTAEAYVGLSQGTTILAENWGYPSDDLYLNLTPGIYVLDSTVTAYASAYPEEFRAGLSELTFSLEELAAPVPEPATALPVAAGILLLAMRLRRP